ncbi:hypothetical protein DF3PB_4390002 [uncultured Defluviicoccus sp.]|uniref:Uncharacterized protein n=1 Tax=metagenome TaxID=256318 RepID=A0A380TG41_9ZZZZ|nr:hypothetical protein DF3PB_4390002 [uncultured Defluviicoccus sp.]
MSVAADLIAIAVSVNALDDFIAAGPKSRRRCGVAVADRKGGDRLFRRRNGDRRIGPRPAEGERGAVCCPTPSPAWPVASEFSALYRPQAL